MFLQLMNSKEVLVAELLAAVFTEGVCIDDTHLSKSVRGHIALPLSLFPTSSAIAHGLEWPTKHMGPARNVQHIPILAFFILPQHIHRGHGVHVEEWQGTKRIA